MRQKRRNCLIFALAAAMVVGTAFTALAEDTKIDKVKLSVSYDRVAKSGDDIGKVYVKTDSSQFRVDYAEYTNEVDTWSVGDEPTIKVELSARTGYRFASARARGFLMCPAAELNLTRPKYDDNYMEGTITLKRIGGKLRERRIWSGAERPHIGIL